MMYQVNGKQILGIVGALISVLMVASAQLTDLFGPGMAKSIVSVAGLINMFLQAVSVTLNTQTAQVKDVLAMPGIERVTVNEQATKSLASVAVDPTMDKIAPTPRAETQVAATAKGE